MTRFIIIASLFITPLALTSAPQHHPANYDSRISPISISGIDAKWSNYGKYLQKLIDAVQIKWDSLNNKTESHPPAGTKIAVKFRINSKGEIAEIISADGNGDAQTVQICKNAITQPAPYDTWTNAMIAMLGDSQIMTFTFKFGKQ